VDQRTRTELWPPSPQHLVVGRQNGVIKLTIPHGLTEPPRPGASFADMWVSSVIQTTGANAKPGSITLTAAPSLPEEMIDILTERFGPEIMDEIDKILATNTPQATVEVSEEQLRALASAVSLKLTL